MDKTEVIKQSLEYLIETNYIKISSPVTLDAIAQTIEEDLLAEEKRYKQHAEMQTMIEIMNRYFSEEKVRRFFSEDE